MAIRWVNNYHKGFNRLWLIFSCLVAFAFIGENLQGYNVYLDNKPYRRVNKAYRVSDEDNIKKRVQKRWHEWKGAGLTLLVPEKGLSPEWKQWADEVFAATGALVDLTQRSNLEKTLARVSLEATLGSILNDVRSMPEAKSFTDKELGAMIKNTIVYETEYQAALKRLPVRKWMARGRYVRDLLGSFIILFAIGHGVFLVGWWIIRGFR